MSQIPATPAAARDLTDAEFAELDDLLAATPEPLEPCDAVMLDGYLCGVLAQPETVPVERWLPPALDWNLADPEQAEPGPGLTPDTPGWHAAKHERLLALVTRHHGEKFDLDEAARREVEWWRVHRELQRESDGALDDLTAALASLYSHVYGVPADRVRAAAAHRAEAMKISDAWVAAGSDATSPAIAAERDELVKGYALLRAAVR